MDGLFGRHPKTVPGILYGLVTFGIVVKANFASHCIIVVVVVKIKLSNMYESTHVRWFFTITVVFFFCFLVLVRYLLYRTTRKANTLCIYFVTNHG